MKTFLNKIVNTGVKPGYQPWEKHLTRKLNSIALISISSITFAISFFIITGYTQFIFDCSLALVALLIAFALNRFKNYKWSAFWFFCYGFYFFIPINLKMGSGSFMILFYFPVIISMVQILGRRETLKQLIILSCICLLSIITIAIGFKLKVYTNDLTDTATTNLAIFNIILSFITTMAYTLVIVSESIRQETLIRKMLKEKEILLAEVFHRVKNNMNIITSLLNLKKNMSSSAEVQNALEDCRSRVFAMALVHENIFNNNNNIIGLNFKGYIKNLITEIVYSQSDKGKVDIVLETEDVNLELSNAISCGLILNELITNSFKYAQSETKKLQIQVILKNHKGSVELQVKDNGPGLPKEYKNNTDSLGLELIKSLSDQIGGVYSFSNNLGLAFNLKFKHVSLKELKTNIN